MATVYTSEFSDPMGNVFRELRTMFQYIVFKDKSKADANETADSRADGEMWINAKDENDSYLTYKALWKEDMFKALDPTLTTAQINWYYENPYKVPFQFQDQLLIEGRKRFLASYEEPNAYYRMLMGLPPLGTTDSVRLDAETSALLGVPNMVKIVSLDASKQNQLMELPIWPLILEANPKAEYLKYIGRNAIDLYAARKAKDFEILRYPWNLSSINPNLLRTFSSVYADYREYVMATIYNASHESLYEGYRGFMWLVILLHALTQTCNLCLESIQDHKYMDDMILYVVLSLYGISDNPLMTKATRRELAVHILQLVRERATDDIYYDLVKILGYHEVVVSKLMLMKGQRFDPQSNNSTTFIPGGIIPNPNDPHPDPSDPYKGMLFVAFRRNDLIDHVNTAFQGKGIPLIKWSADPQRIWVPIYLTRAQLIDKVDKAFGPYLPRSNMVLSEQEIKDIVNKAFDPNYRIAGRLYVMSSSMIKNIVTKVFVEYPKGFTEPEGLDQQELLDALESILGLWARSRPNTNVVSDESKLRCFTDQEIRDIVERCYQTMYPTESQQIKLDLAGLTTAYINEICGEILECWRLEENHARGWVEDEAVLMTFTPEEIEEIVASAFTHPKVPYIPANMNQPSNDIRWLPVTLQHEQIQEIVEAVFGGTHVYEYTEHPPQEYDPYFIQININDPDMYRTIVEGNAPTYTYQEIISADPTWWDLPDTRAILQNSEYTVADTKYITLDAVVHEMEHLMESTIFPRMILDQQQKTDFFLMTVPELFGTKMISIHDAVVFAICAACLAGGFSSEAFRSDFVRGYFHEGKFYTTPTYEERIFPDTHHYYIDLLTNQLYSCAVLNGQKVFFEETQQVNQDRLLSTAGFNFDIDRTLFNEFLETTKYVEVDRLREFLDHLNIDDTSDIERLFHDIICPMRDWLESRISNANSRQEFLEYEAIYQALFTYDATKEQFTDDYQSPMQIIQQDLGISDADLQAYQHFYPRTLTDSRALTTEEFNPLRTKNQSAYSYPFLDRDHLVDWFVNITIYDSRVGREVDRGNLYFHDILNCKDLRYVTNTAGDRIFMDYDDNETGWTINQKAVNKAIQLLEALDENQLKDAYFQVTIKRSDGSFYYKGSKLPDAIRIGKWKDLLIQKMKMDLDGWAVPPTSYLEYLRRKNPDLYQILTKDNRVSTNRDAWLSDVVTVVTALEAALNIHLKNFEQSVIGSRRFFDPLIQMIKRFKSTMVTVARTGLTYVFDDRMDAGGNSNMFKLWDELSATYHFHSLFEDPHGDHLRLLDHITGMRHSIILHDQQQDVVQQVGSGFAATEELYSFGGMHFTDEMKFFKNGEEIDPDGQPSHWISGEPGDGRWEDDSDFIMKTRKDRARIRSSKIDMDGWKEFVISQNPE